MCLLFYSQLLKSPRCGNKDVDDARPRRQKRYVIGSAGWRKRELTYRYDVSPKSPTTEECRFMGKEVRENHCARDFAPAVEANFTRDFQIITQKFTHLSMIFETLLSYEQKKCHGTGIPQASEVSNLYRCITGWEMIRLLIFLLAAITCLCTTKVPSPVACFGLPSPAACYNLSLFSASSVSF